jgi:2-methylisocitrate lyase-like PEP mutase family enzyme
LQAYVAAGADVVFAPGIIDLEEVRTLVAAVAPVPVNVLPGAPGSPTVAELASVGVARISVGGSFAFAAYGALVEAATELRSSGTYGLRAGTAGGSKAVGEAFGPSAG